ncbi:MAG: PIN domain-containing protein [Nitrospira sp.]|nr:PIN domain-containing protein [Nitrospira sp.]
MPTLRRVVFDTNVLISAYLWPGIPRTALDMARNGRIILVSAQPAIEEFVRVLGYRKFGLSLKRLHRWLMI